MLNHFLFKNELAAPPEPVLQIAVIQLQPGLFAECGARENLAPAGSPVSPMIDTFAAAADRAAARTAIFISRTADLKVFS